MLAACLRWVSIQRGCTELGELHEEGKWAGQGIWLYYYPAPNLAPAFLAPPSIRSISPEGRPPGRQSRGQAVCHRREEVTNSSPSGCSQTQSTHLAPSGLLLATNTSPPFQETSSQGWAVSGFASPAASLALLWSAHNTEVDQHP